MTAAGGLTVPRNGDSSVLEVRDVEVADPGPGEVQVAVAAVGVNFIDVYQREVYRIPAVHGLLEGSSTVTAVGDGVQGLAVGDRVAWGQGASSAATLVNRAVDDLVPFPTDSTSRSPPRRCSRA